MIPALALLTFAAVAQDTTRMGPADIDRLPLAATTMNVVKRHLVIELPLTALPAGGMIRTPVYRWTVPEDVALFGFDVELIDAERRPVEIDRLHHVTLTDLSRRELFLPLPLPVFGASRESPRPVFPKRLLGMLLPAGRRYIIAAMFTNPDDRPIELRLRIVLSFVKPGRVFPLFRAYPWTVDVTYPLGGPGGRHDFDLPPGRSRRSWAGSPAVDGRIVAMGGHAHDFATAISMVNETTGDTVWHQKPLLGHRGNIIAIPPARFYRWYRVGVAINARHVYRVSVAYDNPTGETIRYGGMGSVSGLFVPDHGAVWPTLNVNEPMYRAQLHNLLANMTDVSEMNMGGHRHHDR